MFDRKLHFIKLDMDAIYTDPGYSFYRDYFPSGQLIGYIDRCSSSMCVNLENGGFAIFPYKWIKWCAPIPERRSK